MAKFYYHGRMFDEEQVLDNLTDAEQLIKELKDKIDVLENRIDLLEDEKRQLTDYYENALGQMNDEIARLNGQFDI